jgi:hypothetical protein
VTLTFSLFSLVSGEAAAKPKSTPTRTAASSSSDQKTFSLELEPKTHPFCNRTEHDTTNQNRLCEAERVHALLAPSTCLAKDADPDSGAKWDLSPDPFVPAPYWKGGLWSNDPNDWNSMDQSKDKCLAGKADVVLERAYKYGFCSETEYVLGTPPQMPASKFGLDQADYYLMNIVAWKGSPNKLTKISSLGGLKLDTSTSTALDISLDISSDDNKKSFSAASIKDLIKKINEDKNVGATAVLTSTGHLKVSGSTKATSFAVSGAKDVFGDWTNPVEGPYSIDSSRWYSYNHGDHGRWYRQRLDNFNASLRIYGSKKPVGLVALYIEATSGVWDQFSDFKVQYKVEVKTKTAANISDLTSAISIITTKAAAAQRPSSCAATSGPKLDPDGFYGATFINAKAPADLAVSVQVNFPTAPASDSTPQRPALPKPADQTSYAPNVNELGYRSKLKFAVLNTSTSSRDNLGGQQPEAASGSSSNASTNASQPNTNGNNSTGNNGSGNSSNNTRCRCKGKSGRTSGARVIANGFPISLFFSH